MMSFKITFTDIDDENVVEEQLKEALYANGWSDDEFKLELDDYNMLN